MIIVYIYIYRYIRYTVYDMRHFVYRIHQGFPQAPEKRAKLLAPTNSKEPNINSYRKFETNNIVHNCFLFKINSAFIK